MGKNKKLIIRDKMQTLQRVKSQIELVDKILQHNHIVLMCETLEGIKEFVIDINATELDLSHQKITIVRKQELSPDRHPSRFRQSPSYNTIDL